MPKTSMKPIPCRLSEKGKVRFQPKIKRGRHAPLDRTGKIVGESVNGNNWWITWDNQSPRSRESYHKEFIEIIPQLETAGEKNNKPSNE